MCPRGHEWELSPSILTAGDQRLRCPACGLEQETFVLLTPARPEDKTSLPELREGEAQTQTAPVPNRTVVNIEETTRACPGSAAAEASPRPALPDYEILGELGRGGMGVVYRARQLRLNRVVALKMLLDGPLAAAAADRFRAEAHVIAALQHPNIVQLYEEGTYQGRSFLAMEFVSGGSLAQLVAARPQPAVAAAQLVETVARAMHFAHERGIIHRDLKPANILLHRQSEIQSPDSASEKRDSECPLSDFVPKVADFGLAKLLDAGLGQTQTGDVLGTPRYMAPEQADGSPREIGPATDVYALGAILYELLTGRPPFLSANLLDLVDQVRSQEPVPPSRFQPRLPRDVQTICLKCLEKDSGRRYPTALALADDLRAFLENKPIRARPVGRLERLRKWARRQPALAALVVVSVLATLGLVLGMIGHNAALRDQVVRAETSEAQARKDQERAAANEALAQRQRQRADSQYNRARDVLRKMLDRVNEKKVAGTPRLRELQQLQVEDALAFFQGVLKDEDNPDPAVQADVATAYFYTGYYEGLIGRKQQAEENQRHALALFENLAVQQPDVLEHRDHASTCYYDLAMFCQDSGRPKLARTYFERSIELRQGLVHARPDVILWQRDLAASQFALGTLYLTQGERALAREQYQKVLPSQELLNREHPDDVLHQVGLANTRQMLGLLDHQEGNPEGADAAYREAAKLLAPLQQQNPADFDYALDLAKLYINWGLTLLTYRDWAKDKPEASLAVALAHYTRAVNLAEPILQQEPRYAGARYVVHNAHGGRAQTHEALGQWAQAITDWERAVPLAEGQGQVNERIYIARALARLGNHERATTEARDLVEKAAGNSGALFELARIYCLAVSAVQRETQRSQSERAGLTDQYGAAAVQVLLRIRRLAGPLQMADFQKIVKEDSAFAVLRARPDYPPVIADLNLQDLLPGAK
jgi:serine/threonine protein kinase